MVIKVTTQHIEQCGGARRILCPIETACRAVGLRRASCFGVVLTARVAGRTVTFPMPEVVKRFVSAWDLDVSVEPFEFVIPLDESEVR